MTASVPPDTDRFWANLPAKRVGAGALITDQSGRMLLVEPTYKDNWEIPGGLVEVDEPPVAAVRRELREELGLDRQVGRLLCVDWTPPRPPRTEGINFIFDGGTFSPDDTAAIQLPVDELASHRFCTLDEAADRLLPMMHRRISATLAALAAGSIAYLENGYPPAG